MSHASRISGRFPWIRAFSYALLGLGSIARIAPLFDQGGRLLQQYPTEDGYLMLTLARNIALGHGMSTAAGTIPSNGTHPLATLLWAATFLFSGGDKVLGVAWVLVLQWLIAAAAALALYRLACLLLADRPDFRDRALLAAAAWFAVPLLVRHSMNCLETGLYALCLILSLHLVLRPGPPRPGLALDRWAGLGLMLGVTAWARLDAVLLCAALAAVHLGWGLPGGAGRFSGRLAQLAVAGSVTVAVISPWLAYGYVGFGSFMPISGQAESLGAEFGQNLPRVFPNLLEYLLLPFPIPAALEARWPTIVGAAALEAAAVVWLLRSARTSIPVRKAAIRLGLVWALSLAAFYGLYFGAGHFMSRYLFALSPLCAIAWADVGYGLLSRSYGHAALRVRLVGAGALSALALVTAGLAVRDYARGDQHPHFQVVRWVADHVPETTWVGAIQTGTLGFFHDRTINLDGKVNPLALRARELDRIPAYVARSPIRYLVDWSSIVTWMRLPLIDAHFDVRERDPVHNLAVLERHVPAELARTQAAARP